MEAIGVCDGKVDPCGALAYKSYREIAADIRTVFEQGLPQDEKTIGYVWRLLVFVMGK